MSTSLSVLTAALVPLEVPTGGLEHGGGHALGFLEPLIGLGVFAVVLALLVAALVLLRRRGLLPAVALASWFAPRAAASPEHAARQLLAERFARGEMTTEDFMERASVLNWTPGVESPRPGRIGPG